MQLVSLHLYLALCPSPARMFLLNLKQLIPSSLLILCWLQSARSLAGAESSMITTSSSLTLALALWMTLAPVLVCCPQRFWLQYLTWISTICFACTRKTTLYYIYISFIIISNSPDQKAGRPRRRSRSRVGRGAWWSCWRVCRNWLAGSNRRGSQCSLLRMPRTESGYKSKSRVTLQRNFTDIL